MTATATLPKLLGIDEVADHLAQLPTRQPVDRHTPRGLPQRRPLRRFDRARSRPSSTGAPPPPCRSSPKQCALVDAGFTTGWFAEALAGVDRFADAEFSRYGVSPEQIAAVRETMRSWSAELADRSTRAQADDAARPAATPARGTTASHGAATPSRTPWPGPYATPDAG